MGGGISDDGGDTAQPAGRTIRERGDVLCQVEGAHASLKVKAEFFHANDGLVVSSDPGWLQSVFGTDKRPQDYGDGKQSILVNRGAIR